MWQVGTSSPDPAVNAAQKIFSMASGGSQQDGDISFPLLPMSVLIGGGLAFSVPSGLPHTAKGIDVTHHNDFLTTSQGFQNYKQNTQALASGTKSVPGSLSS